MEYTQFETPELLECMMLVAGNVGDGGVNEHELKLVVQTTPGVAVADDANNNTPIHTNTQSATAEDGPDSVPNNANAVYTIIQKCTGGIGGCANGGAIYGELTMRSMHRVIDFMIKHTGLSKESRFIDVGCGLAKPNLHVAQYPGVEFSYGIELIRERYLLGMLNIQQVLKAASKDTMIGHKCILSHGDINQAKSFDPFTHVYMFDVG